MDSNTISNRGENALNTVLRPDMELFRDAVSNIYNVELNPEGAFPLNVAENRLTWYLLKEKLETITSKNKIPDWVAGYTASLGHQSFREVFAHFFSKYITHCPIDPNQIGISSGVTAIIEISSLILADQGDVAVFPAPSYPVYKQDIGYKAKVERYDLQTHHNPNDLSKGLILTTELLNKAKKDIEDQGKTFQLLILTQPDNPTGGIYTKTQLNDISNWCIDNHIHLIVNEIYALSILNTEQPDIKTDYKVKAEFTSFAPIMQEKQSPFLHLWYGLSKDFGISGLRIGMVYTLNNNFLKAFSNLNAPHMVSNHTQWLLEQVLSDENFINQYIKEHQKNLTEAYVLVTKTLKTLNIPYVPSYGSLFVWVDCSKFLNSPTQESETEFWKQLYTKTGVLLTPGLGFGHTQKGLFRIVYTCFDLKSLKIALKRLEMFF